MYWESEEKKCRVCEYEKETWEHVWDGCARGLADKGGWQENVMRIVEWSGGKVDERMGK